MVKALAPLRRRGFPWVGLALFLSWAGSPDATAQTTKKVGDPPKSTAGKDASKKGAAANKAEAPGEGGRAAAGESKAMRSEPVEVYRDQRTLAALKVFKPLFVDAAPRADNLLDAMAQGKQAVDPAAILGYIRAQAKDLTNRKNLQALMDAGDNPAPGSPWRSRRPSTA